MFRTFKPHSILRDFILFYFELDWKKKSPDDSIKYLSIPTGCSFMGFQKKGRMEIKMGDYNYATKKYYVNAQTTVPYQMHCSANHLNVLVACLKPTTLYHLFNIDVSKIVNTGTSPEHLFRDELHQFSSSYDSENTIEERIDLLNGILVRQLYTSRPTFNFIDSTIDLIITKKGKVNVRELCHKFNVSQRYFQKKFKEMIGIPPSLYIKIIRYNFIFSSFKERDCDFKSSSASFYFYDSSHYSKSFKKFMGISPSKFDTAQYPFINLTAIEQAVWTSAFQALTN